MDKKKVVGFALAALIALGSYFTLGTSVGDAINIAFNKDAAKAACQNILTGDTATDGKEVSQ